jgi:hypothetical protein
MPVQRDFKELLESLNNHNVKYVIVGGYALAFHGAPRFTGDLDIFVEPDKSNARRVLEALSDFGFASADLTEDDFSVPDRVVQLGVPPVRVDILTSITKVSWAKAWKGRIKGKYGDVATCYIGLAEFTINKRALGRKKDLADLESLGKE